MMPILDVPAEILMGEAGVCGFWGFLAVLHVAMNRGGLGGFYGWQVPNDTAIGVSQWGYLLPDPTDRATFIFSHQDLSLSAVQKIVAGRELTWKMTCVEKTDETEALGLYAYR